MRMIPVLLRRLPGGVSNGLDPDRVADWLRGLGRVRPRVAALDDALVAGVALASAPEGDFRVVQGPADDGGSPGA